MVLHDESNENDLRRNRPIKLEKHVEMLKIPTNKTIALITVSLKKSKKRFKIQADELKDEKDKKVIVNKLNKISNELKILRSFKEDEIISFALNTPHNLMAVAVNRRLPLRDRLKARVACHKPFSSHLRRVKSNLHKAEESESEEEDENEDAEISPKKLDKMILNNQIVKMKKDIKRAKVHIIHKLTRQVNILRNKKGNDKAKAKFERKAARLVEKIKCIKELFEDDVAKFALTTSEDVNKLSTNIKASLKTQSMATLVAHKIVAAPVCNFKNAFPDWEKTVPKLIMKKKKKRKLINTIKDSNMMDTNLSVSDESEQMDSENEESEEEGKEGNDENDIEKMTDVGYRSEDDDESSIEEGQDHTNSNSQLKSDILKHNGNHSSSLNDSDNDTSSGMHNKVNDRKTDKLKLNIKANFENKGIVDEEKETPNTQNTITKKNKNNLNSPRKMPKPKHIPKVVDPFFITSTNEEYVTNQIPVTVEEKPKQAVKNNKFESDFNKFSKLGNQDKWDVRDYKKSNKFDSHHRNDRFNNKPFTNYFEKSSFTNKSPFTNQVQQPPHSNKGPIISLGNRKERRKALHQPVLAEKVEKLHPSWEAKKKLPAIASFEGKKIKFD